MRAIKTLMLIVGLGMSLPSRIDAQAPPQVKRALPLKNPDNACVATSFARRQGKAALKLTSKCRSTTALVCTVLSATSTWQCEMLQLNSTGQTWLAPFPAERSSVYHVGACKLENAGCQNAMIWLYAHIIGQPKRLDPRRLKPVEACQGPDCGPPPPPPPPPPAPERG